MIERAPEEYHKTLTYEEAVLYCFSLNIDGKTGWRLPSKEELVQLWSTHELDKYTLYWAQEEADYYRDRMAPCVYNDGISYGFVYKTERVGTLPVRDLKDD